MTVHFEERGAVAATLTARLYCDAGVFAEDLTCIHRTAWHPLCHLSEVPEAGSTYGLNLLGRRVSRYAEMIAQSGCFTMSAVTGLMPWCCRAPAIALAPS